MGTVIIICIVVIVIINIIAWRIILTDEKARCINRQKSNKKAQDSQNKTYNRFDYKQKRPYLQWTNNGKLANWVDFTWCKNEPLIKAFAEVEFAHTFDEVIEAHEAATKAYGATHKQVEDILITLLAINVSAPPITTYEFFEMIQNIIGAFPPNKQKEGRAILSLTFELAYVQFGNACKILKDNIIIK